jgi:hypothetical protein
VYFDNCLIGAIVKEDHPAEAGALSTLVTAIQTNTLRGVASTESLGEIERLPPEHRGRHEEVWQQFECLPALDIPWIAAGSTSLSTDPDYEVLRRLLPDETDRHHVLFAAKHGVKYFATVDRRTILVHAPALEARFGIRFGTPSDIVRLLGLTTTSSG